MTGTGKVVRSYPMVPGIDLAGSVAESASSDFEPGDQVVLTGWGIGERHWGGYAQKARVRAEWLTPLPEGLTMKEAMAIGTAGLTAMLCVMALEEHGLRPGGMDVLVTRAACGVGSLAVAILAQRGYRVVASSGRASAHDFLRSLGAAEVIDRSVLATPSGRPLESERWGGAVDTVGGERRPATCIQCKTPPTRAAFCCSPVHDALTGLRRLRWSAPRRAPQSTPTGSSSTRRSSPGPGLPLRSARLSALSCQRPRRLRRIRTYSRRCG